MSFLCMLIQLDMSLEQKKGRSVSVDIMMMNTNYDKQYKTEALVMLENDFFYGEKNKQYEGELFPDVCVNTR